MGILVGIGLGGTAISIPMAIVGKHFPLSNRTIAMSLVTAIGSFGYFLSPLLTTYSLSENGWQITLIAFLVALFIGLIVSYFVRSPSLEQSIETPNSQSTLEAIKEAFASKSYILLVSGFLFVVSYYIGRNTCSNLCS